MAEFEANKYYLVMKGNNMPGVASLEFQQTASIVLLISGLYGAV
jgi:hypothetical protein